MTCAVYTDIARPRQGQLHRLSNHLSFCILSQLVKRVMAANAIPQFTIWRYAN